MMAVILNLWSFRLCDFLLGERRLTSVVQTPCVGGILLVLLHERIGVIKLHVSKGMVDIAVVCFIGHHAFETINELRICW